MCAVSMATAFRVSPAAFFGDEKFLLTSILPLAKFSFRGFCGFPRVRFCANGFQWKQNFGGPKSLDE